MKLELEPGNSIEVCCKNDYCRLSVSGAGQGIIYLDVTSLELSMIIHLLQTHLLSKQGKEA